MKLFHAPRSPFSFKARIAVHELGLAARVDLVLVDPWTDESLRALNPLCKVPTLVLDDTSTAIYDSAVICQYLDHAAGGGRLIPQGAQRWEALRHETLADGLAEAVIRRYVEQTDPIGERAARVIERQEKVVTAALDALERLTRSAAEEMAIGQIATGAALTYLSFRSPEIQWRLERHCLAAWFDEFDPPRRDQRRLSLAGGELRLPPGRRAVDNRWATD